MRQAAFAVRRIALEWLDSIDVLDRAALVPRCSR